MPADNTPAALREAEQETFCYEARAAGYSLPQIVPMYRERFGVEVSQATISRRITAEGKARAKLHERSRERLRDLELERLDAVQRQYVELTSTTLEVDDGLGGTRIVRRPDDDRMKAMDGILKVSDRRRKLLGLDAPERLEVTVETTSADPEIAAMIAQAEASANASSAT